MFSMLFNNSKSLTPFNYFTACNFIRKARITGPALGHKMLTVNQFNLAAIKFSVLKVLNIRH